MSGSANGPIVVVEVHCDDEELMLLAWGVHPPDAFLAACHAAEVSNG